MAEHYKITADDLETSVKQHKPELLGAFETIKPKLNKLVTQKELSAFIGEPVEVRAEDTHLYYTWKKGEASYEMCVARRVETTSDQNSSTQPAELSEHGSKATISVPEEEAVSTDETEAPAPAATPNVIQDTLSRGIFAALEQLVGNDTLMMSFCKTGGRLQVTVSGFDETFQPICLTGTADELEAGLPGVLYDRAAAINTFEEQVAALKKADKELQDAKKEEATAKRQAANKAREKAKDAKEKSAEAKGGRKKEEPKASEAEMPNLFAA